MTDRSARVMVFVDCSNRNHLLKDNGKNVEVVPFGKEQTSRQLREVADRISR